MGSIAAQEVAKEVLETVRKGKRPNLGKIIKEKGYALTTSTVPTQVTKTKSYQKVIKPYAERLQKHQEKVLRAMEEKDLSAEQYKTLADALAKITHDVQVLTGGSTDNIAQKVLVEFIDAKENINPNGV
jgi:hypothetical protein